MRAAIVEQHPAALEVDHACVRARHLEVPFESHIVGRVAADAHARLAVEVEHLLPAVPVAIAQVREPAPRLADALAEQSVGTTNLAGLGERYAELEQQVGSLRMRLRHQRHRPLEQVHRCRHVAAGQRATPRVREPRGRLGREFDAVLVQRSEVVEVAVCLLQVIAEDLLVLTGPLARLLFTQEAKAREALHASLQHLS